MSDYGKAIPLQYGRCRIVGNLIWYADFTSVKRTDPTPNADRHDFSPREPNRK
jgi:hypothetical protein